MARTLTPWRMTWTFWLAALLLSVFWLDGLGRYLEARFHAELPAWMDGAWQAPSRVRQQLAAGLSGQKPPPWTAPVANGFQEPLPWVPVAPQAEVVTGELALPPLRPGPQKILLAGDSMMQGLAPLFMRDLATLYPDWQVIDRSRHSTGLTLRRYFDWPAHIASAIDKEQISLLVVFLGPNDPWDLVEDGERFLFPSAAWQSRYARRVDEIHRLARARGVRVLWLGLPNMANPRLREGSRILNQIFLGRARAWHSGYQPTDTLVGDLRAPYSRSGPDELGRETLWRAQDGVHFTPAGLRRIEAALLAQVQKAVRP